MYHTEEGNYDDEGPSSEDCVLFYFPGIVRQYIANENFGLYEFDIDGNKRWLKNEIDNNDY